MRRRPVRLHTPPCPPRRREERRRPSAHATVREHNWIENAASRRRRLSPAAQSTNPSSVAQFDLQKHQEYEIAAVDQRRPIHDAHRLEAVRLAAEPALHLQERRQDRRFEGLTAGNSSSVSQPAVRSRLGTTASPFAAPLRVAAKQNYARPPPRRRTLYEIIEILLRLARACEDAETCAGKYSDQA